MHLSAHRLREKSRRLRDIIGQHKYLVPWRKLSVQSRAWPILSCFLIEPWQGFAKTFPESTSMFSISFSLSHEPNFFRAPVQNCSEPDRPSYFYVIGKGCSRFDASIIILEISAVKPNTSHGMAMHGPCSYSCQEWFTQVEPFHFTVHFVFRPVKGTGAHPQLDVDLKIQESACRSWSQGFQAETQLRLYGRVWQLRLSCIGHHLIAFAAFTRCSAQRPSCTLVQKALEVKWAELHGNSRAIAACCDFEITALTPWPCQMSSAVAAKADWTHNQ